MEGSAISLSMACIGSLGFSIVFKTRPSLLPCCALGGFLSWSIYLICSANAVGIFGASLLASAAVSFYASTAARILHAPATVFLVPSTVPLVPGGSLYYAFSYLIEKDFAAFLLTFSDTILAAGGIAAGIVGISILEKFLSPEK